MEKIPPNAAEKATPPVPHAPGSARFAPGAGCAAAAILILFPALLYFGFFGAILIDELVLDTSYIGRNLPRGMKDVAEFIYAPLFGLVEEMGFRI